MYQLPFSPEEIERVFVSFSGGKDSTASLLRVLEVFPPEKVTAIFGDTGAELPDAYDYMRWFNSNIFPVLRVGQRITGTRQTTRGGRQVEMNELENVYLGWDDPVGARDVLTLKDIILQRKRRSPETPGWPSPTNRYCTKALKSQAIAKYIRAETTVDERKSCLHVLGLRRSESKKREKTPDWEFDYDLRIQAWYPVASWTVSDVVQYAAEKEVPLSPVYAHVSRANCGICFFSSVKDMINVARSYPGYLDDYIQIEKATGSIWTAEISLEEVQKMSEEDDPEQQPFNMQLPLFEEQPTCMSGYCDAGGGTIPEEYLWKQESE